MKTTTYRTPPVTIIQQGEETKKNKKKTGKDTIIKKDLEE